MLLSLGLRPTSQARFRVLGGSFVRVVALLTFAALLGDASAQAYGLESPSRFSVTAFVDGALPLRSPGGGASYQIRDAFPAIALRNTLVITAKPCRPDHRPTSPLRRIPRWRCDVLPKSSVGLRRGRRGLSWTCGIGLLRSGTADFLGMVFHPQFGVSGSPYQRTFYAYYSSYCPTTAQGTAVDFTKCNGAYPRDLTWGFFNTWLRLSRFEAEWDGDAGIWRGVPESESPMLNIRLYNFTHRGGGLTFGSDGYLYLTIGDQFRYTTAQDITNTLEGGILRLAVDITQTAESAWTCPLGSHQPRRTFQGFSSYPDELSGHLYCIPDDNPWLSPSGDQFEEYFSIGHRAPHRLALDPETGDLWSGEVGESTREEINLIRRGMNYGWPFREGMIAGPRPQPASYIGTLTDPVIDFMRTEAQALIGGYVYRGTSFPELSGRYIAGDYVKQTVWAITLDRNTMTATKEVIANFSPGALSTFGQDNQGEIYLGSVASNIPLQHLERVTDGAPEPPALLSATGIFEDLQQRSVNPAAIPYDVVPFWSDGALKSRWIFLPDNDLDGVFSGADEQIVISEQDNWSFPIGTVLVKHFDLPLTEGDPSTAVPIETRVMALGEDAKWYGVTYRWREDGTDADLLVTSDTREFLISSANGTRSQTWTYPSRDACLVCHNSGAGGALGLRTHQLNRDAFYPSTGLIDNQLRAWNHLGAFTNALNEAEIPTFLAGSPVDDFGAPVEHRARSWLDVNCSYCHRPETGNRATFDTRLTTSLENTGLINGAVSNTLGIAGARLIRPGNPEASIVHVRASQVDTPFAMPPLAKSLPDVAGLSILTEWIEGIGVGTGEITPAITTPTGTANLTGEGVADWVHWGKDSASSVNRKAGVAAQIGALTTIGGSAARFGDTARLRYSWSDGTPTGSATTQAGLYIAGLNKGYQLQVPADTSARTLVVYLGGWQARGRIEVSLSDGSAPAFVQTVENLSTAFDRRLALSYRAGSAGQTLTVRYLQETSSGNITMQAATLQGTGAPVNQPPVLAAIADQSGTVGSTLTVGVSASDADGPAPLVLTTSALPGRASFSDAGDGSGTLSWTPLAGDVAGSPYSVTVTATDGAGAAASRSFNVTVAAAPGGGQLTPAITTPTGTANLTGEGVADWVHWGKDSASSVNRKAGVAAQIGALTTIGGSAARFGVRGTSRATAGAMGHRRGVPPPRRGSTSRG